MSKDMYAVSRVTTMRRENQDIPDPQAGDPSTNVSASLDIAVRLLEFQQRMAAFDRLYNEEISGLAEGLSQLKADFVRQNRAQAQGTTMATEPKRSRRGARRPKAPRSVPKQPVGGESPQEG
jgi:hypothetical protein